MEAGLIFGFWAVLALLSLGNELLEPREGGAFAWSSPHVVYTLALFGVWMLLTPGVFWLCCRFPLDEDHGWRNAALHLALAFAAAFAVDLFTDGLRYALDPESSFPPEELQRFLFRDLLALDVLYELTIYLAPLAAGFARSYFLRLRERQARERRLEARTERLQHQLTEARLQALRMQLNPHFLFNTLHAVSTLVGDDPAGVRRMIARLSRLLRHVLEGSGRDEVPLREEMAFLRAYLDIMRIRFQGRLEVELHTPEAIEDALVPNLILQPLVENAVKHGAGEVEKTGHVTVEARRVEDTLLLEVRDNGPRFQPGGDAPDLEAGTGLENVRTRLGELHGAAASLSFRVAEGGGLVAQVRLPFRPADGVEPRAESLRAGLPPAAEAVA
jgi:signal transduction histidine kinase